MYLFGHAVGHAGSQFSYQGSNQSLAHSLNLWTSGSPKKQVLILSSLISEPLLFSSIQFSYSVVSDYLRPHELQHARSPCPSPTPRVYPNPCLLSWRCHPTIIFSVVPFSCPQSFPASGSFPMSQLFASDGHSIGVSASASVHLMNTQD